MKHKLKRRRYKITSSDYFVFRDPVMAVKILERLDDGIEALKGIKENVSCLREVKQDTSCLREKS